VTNSAGMPVREVGTLIFGLPISVNKADDSDVTAKARWYHEKPRSCQIHASCLYLVGTSFHK
jgi:hypothetical protein